MTNSASVFGAPLLIMQPSPLLTQSRLATLRQCPRKHWYRYEVGLARATTANYLRIGKAFHRGLELRGLGATQEAAIADALLPYSAPPPGVDEHEYAVERETVAHLLAGYYWRYENDELAVQQTELQFHIPLVNPDSARASAAHELAGKIDAIVRLPDGRLALLEYKTAGEDIGPESDYWLRLRGDAQISTYMIAARALGYDIATVMYDVTRKPTIRPRQIPLTDADGLKIVLDAAGARVLTKQGKPRQTGDTELGYMLQTRPETPEEFGRRLLADIADRPDYYYQRREVPRLDDDLAECRVELWQQSQQLLETRRRGRWFRNVTRMNCGGCEFAGICLNNVTVDPANPPSGFVVLENVHPELDDLDRDE